MRQTILKAARALGLFRLTRMFTGSGLRILCYHGISCSNEHEFQPKLFMQEQTFRQRVAYLRRTGYRVLGLSKALSALDEGKLLAHSVVITFDDGWLGTGLLAAPVLAENDYPSTLYVTSRDVIDEAPVFDVVLRYMLWFGRDRRFDVAWLNESPVHVELLESKEREFVAGLITARATGMDLAGRLALLEDVAVKMKVDWQSLKQARLFRLMSLEQLAALPVTGMELQLHTHNHRLPQEDRQVVEDEIAANRRHLQSVASTPLIHFCYPSGEFDPRQFDWLRNLGVVSATTCVSGFNYHKTERMALRRFLDAESISEVEFEAELSGFLEVLRGVRSAMRRLRSAVGA